MVAVGAHGQEPLGVVPGDQFPVSFPYGAIAMAWRPTTEVDQWIESAPTVMTSAEQEHERRVMADIGCLGFGVWSLEARAAPLVDRIRSIVGDLAAGPTRPQVHEQLTELFAIFGRHGYTADELATCRTLSVGYVLAPVFGADGQPRYQIDLHLLRPTMSRAATRHGPRAGPREPRHSSRASSGANGPPPSLRQGSSTTLIDPDARSAAAAEGLRGVVEREALGDQRVGDLGVRGQERDRSAEVAAPSVMRVRHRIAHRQLLGKKGNTQKRHLAEVDGQEQDGAARSRQLEGTG